MRRFILIGIMVLSAISGFAQDATKVQTLKEQQKVLNLTSKLNKLQLDYEKAKADYDDIISRLLMQMQRQIWLQQTSIRLMLLAL